MSRKGKISINDRFSSLSPSTDGVSRRFKTPKRYRRRVVKIEPSRKSKILDILTHCHTLGNRELEILAFRDLVKLRLYQVRSTYRDTLISETKEILHGLSDQQISSLYQKIPFSVERGQHPVEDLEEDLEDSDERDWDCRPSTIGEVTEEELDQELEEYFSNDPRKHSYQDKMLLDD